MRSIIVYCAFAAQLCTTSLSSTIPTTSESVIRLPIHDDENHAAANSADTLSDIFHAAPRESRNSWSKIRNNLVHRIFGSGEKHGRLNHPHYSSGSSASSGGAGGQKPLGDTPKVPYSRYQNDVVLRFNLTTTEEAAALAEAAEILFLDVWSATKDHADIRVDKDVVESLLGLLPGSLKSSHARLMHDLAATVRETFPGSSSEGPSNPLSPHSLSQYSGPYRPAQSEHFFSNYQPISVINPWMKLLESLFPDHVQLFSIGQTYEGREIKGVKISRSGEPSSGKRKAIVITGASHAREWISVSTVCYLAHAFITGYRPRPFDSDNAEDLGDREITRLVENFDWYFIPTLNVDGYVYTWTEDRLWRKNRQPTSLAFCKGIELDRSYSFQWGGQSQNNPCSENYPGEKEFEALESKNFAAWAQNLTTEGNTRIMGFLDLHSYSQQILYPYSYSCSQKPPDLENLEELAEVLAKGIRIRHGEHYEVSSACQGGGHFTSSSDKKSKKAKRSTEGGEGDGFTLTETGGGGSALDYFYREIGVAYSYQIKLRDQGSYGFLLPKESIKPTGQEIESMVKSLGNFLIGDDKL
ncbi:putative metallocarboxypeptidase ecm14 [Arthrobotrys musiformis]|uniref:Inactive metallocarboxypeptidase ECM14 n=1 Tax=Arthrobotrys musiformis TaxID=47236 RepID=A0AAV9W3N1_9PEZI